MKKVFTGLVGLAVVSGGLFYYGSQKLVADEINTHLVTLKTHGFVIEDRKQDSSGDHFIISLADMHKFSKLIPEYESVLLAEDKSALKEFKLGVDMISSASEVSVDIYPVSFPSSELSVEEKAMLTRYIDEKTLTLHLEYNTLTNSFNGNLKDIDEQIKNAIGIKLIGLAFSGKINDEKLALNYELNEFKIADDKKSIIEISGLSTTGTYEGLNYYVSNGTTEIDKVLVNIPDTTDRIEFIDTELKISSDIKNDLFESRLNMSTKTVDAANKNGEFKFDNFILDYGVKNINLDAFNKLTISLDQENPNFRSQEIKQNIKDLLADGMMIDLYKFGFENITHDGETLKGFSLQTNFQIENNFDIEVLKVSPMQALSSVTMNSKIEISDEIFEKSMKNPKAKMAMTFKPKEENGYKIYDIELKDSHVSVNGMLMM